MYSFLLSRPRNSRPNPDSYESCVTINESTITTKEKYSKKCTFTSASQIQLANDRMYSDTIRPHVKTLLRNSSGVVTDCRAEKQVMTVIGFGASGSGKTYSLLGMDSTGVHNDNSLLRGIVSDMEGSKDKSIAVEITQVYCNQVLVLCERCDTSYSRIMGVIIESFSSWKQQVLRTHNSSRAHLCIRLICKTHEIRIIDTAGFEKSDDERSHKETVHINKDMLALKECIRKINNNDEEHKSNSRHIPYRQRTLTHMLFRDTKFKCGSETDHTIFMFGAIDPYASREECEKYRIEANPKHPRLASVTNTLQYITMIGGAEINVMKREQQSKPSVYPPIRPRSNSLPGNVSPRTQVIGQQNIPKLKKISESSLTSRHKRISKKFRKLNNGVSNSNILPSPPDKNKTPDAPKPSSPMLPPKIIKYIHNQMTLLDRFLTYDYSKQYREVMETVNDQQVLASNILLEIVYDVSNAKEFGSEN